MGRKTFVELAATSTKGTFSWNAQKKKGWSEKKIVVNHINEGLKKINYRPQEKIFGGIARKARARLSN